MYVPNLDTCAYFIHAGDQPDPHSSVYLRVATEFKQYLLAIMYTRYYFEVDIDTSRGTGQYRTVAYNVSCSQYRNKQQTNEDTMSVWRTLRDNGLLDLFMPRGVGSATGAS